MKRSLALLLAGCVVLTSYGEVFRHRPQHLVPIPLSHWMKLKLNPPPDLPRLSISYVYLTNCMIQLLPDSGVITNNGTLNFVLSPATNNVTVNTYAYSNWTIDVSWTTSPTNSEMLQCSPDLHSWSNIPMVFTGASRVQQWFDTGQAPKRFFRLWVQP